MTTRHAKSVRAKVSKNPRKRHIPRKILQWGKQHVRSTKKTRRDFKTIARKAAKEYGSKAAGLAVAGAARWKRLREKYKAAHSHAKANPLAGHAARYRVEFRVPDRQWELLAVFKEKKIAEDYARQIHRKNNGFDFRVVD